MSNSSALDPRLRRSDALDGLRTIAVAFVVLYHFHVPGFGGGFIGVNVFFVLSGYLITSILLREHRATGRIRLVPFWVRRVLRLYPALLVMVLVGVTLWALLGNDGGANVAPQSAALLALSYTGNLARSLGHLSQGVFAPTWSLATEEQFYLVWPPILFLLLSRRARVGVVLAALGVLVVASSAAGWLLYDDRGGSATPDIYFNPIFNVAPLLMGCILAIGALGRADAARARRAPRRTACRDGPGRHRGDPVHDHRRLEATACGVRPGAPRGRSGDRLLHRGHGVAALTGRHAPCRCGRSPGSDATCRTRSTSGTWSCSTWC